MSDTTADFLRGGATATAPMTAYGQGSGDPTADFLRAGASADNKPSLGTPNDQQGIFDRIKSDYQKRLNEGQQAIDAHNSGQQGSGLTALDYLGKVGFGTVADAGGEAIKSIASYAPQGVKNAVSNTVSNISNSPVGVAARAVGNQYQDLAQRYPNATRHVEAIADIGSVLAPEVPIKGTSIAGAAMDAAQTGGKAVGKFVGDAAKDLITSPEKPIVKGTLGDAAAADKAAASKAYNVSAAENVQFTPQALQDLSGKLTSLAPKADAEARVWNKSQAASHANDLLETMQKEPLTLNGALAQRSSINDSWKAAKRSGKDNEARMLSEVKDVLDKTMMNQDTATWQNANHLWAKAATKQDLADMVTSAEGRAQPANSLDTAINKYLNGWKGDVLPNNERAALQDVVNNTAKSELFKSVSGRLINHVATGVGARVGGIPGAIAGHLIGTYGSMFARDAAMTAKLKKLDTVFEAIDKRPSPSIAKSTAQRPMLSLPPPNIGTNFHVDSLGNISRTPNAASEVVNTKPNYNYPPSKPPQRTMGEIAKMPPYEAMKYLNNFRKNR